MSKNNYRMFDQLHLTVEAKDLTVDERRMLRKSIRSMADQVRGYIENQIVSAELLSKVKVTIEQ